MNKIYKFGKTLGPAGIFLLMLPSFSHIFLRDIENSWISIGIPTASGVFAGFILIATIIKVW
jgi:hypothetical protein